MAITVAYSLIIILMGLFTNMKNNKSRIIYLVLSGIILIIISGLRSYYLGSGDTSRYAVMFENIYGNSSQQILNAELKDPGYHIFSSYVGNIIGDNFQALLIVFGAIFMFSYSYLTYLKSPNLLISFIILFSFGFFYFSMHGVRQGLAMSFIMLSYIPLRNNKIILFILLVLISSLFHKTALIFLIAYPFCKIGFKKYSWILYLGLIVLLIFFGQEMVQLFTEELADYDERFQLYLDDNATLNFSGLIQLGLILLMILFNIKRFLEKDKEASILISLLCLAIVFQGLAIYLAEMFRLAMYFSLFLVILVPRLLQTYPQSNKKLITISVCVLLMVYFYSNKNFLDYDFYWNDYKTHF